MEGIVVKVIGPTGSGKSTVAEVIADALSEYGFEFKVEDDGPAQSSFADRVHGLVADPDYCVTIKTVQTAPPKVKTEVEFQIDPDPEAFE